MAYLKLKEVLSSPDLMQTFTAMCEEISDTLDSLKPLIKKHGFNYWLVHKMCKANDELADIYNQAITDRALTYYDLAAEAVEQFKKDTEFWDADHVDMNGCIHSVKKERQTAVNRTRLYIDFYTAQTERLAPEFFGDYDKKLKEISSQLILLHKRLDGMTN